MKEKCIQKLSGRRKLCSLAARPGHLMQRERERERERERFDNFGAHAAEEIGRSV